MLLVRRRAPDGQLLRGRRSRGRRLRRARDRLRRAARLRRLPRVRELRHLAQRRRGRGADRRAAVRDGAVPARAVRAPLSGELVCYARTVVHQEWPQMEAGTLGDATTPGASSCSAPCRRSSRDRRPSRRRTAKWLDQRSDRESARADRIHGAEGVIPLPLWIVLFLSAGVIFVFMLFFADSAERAVVQATMMGGVAVVITSTLLLLWFLDNPYHDGVGRPAAGRDGAHRRASDARPGDRRRTLPDPVRRERSPANALSAPAVRAARSPRPGCAERA